MLLLHRTRRVAVSAETVLLTVALVVSGGVAWPVVHGGGAWSSFETSLSLFVALALLIGGVATIKIVSVRGSDLHVRSLFRRHWLGREQCAFGVERGMTLDSSFSKVYVTDGLQKIGIAFFFSQRGADRAVTRLTFRFLIIGGKFISPLAEAFATSEQQARASRAAIEGNLRGRRRVFVVGAFFVVAGVAASALWWWLAR